MRLFRLTTLIEYDRKDCIELGITCWTFPIAGSLRATMLRPQDMDTTIPRPKAVSLRMYMNLGSMCALESCFSRISVFIRQYLPIKCTGSPDYKLQSYVMSNSPAVGKSLISTLRFSLQL